MGEKLTITIHWAISTGKHELFSIGEKCRQRARGYAHQSGCQTNSRSYWRVEGAAAFVYIKTILRHAWRGFAQSRS